MKIEREVHQKLIEWKAATNRKPLILQEARQVGKTWLLKTFDAEEFVNVAYFNFDEQPELITK
jgi:predicted AAA+ superfamily ATPase